MVKYLGILTGVLVILYLAYWLKVSLGVSLGVGEKHFPCYIQQYTAGLVRCEWFPNSHHCNCDD